MFNGIRNENSQCSALTACCYLFVFTNFCCAELSEPQVEWTTKLVQGLDASPIAYPSENPDSVVIAAGGYVVRVSGDGNVVFEKHLGPKASRDGIFDPSAVDLDGDGVEEIVAGHNGGFVFAINASDGTVLWEHELGADIGGWRSANPADLDGDGQPETLITARDGWVRCLDHDGTLRWRSKVEEYRLGTPSVGDIDNDGKPEIVYGTATRHLIALEADGRVLWDAFAGPLHLGRTKPIIADLDRDGAAEVYAIASNIGPETGLISVNGEDGKIRWYGKTRHKAYMARAVVPFTDGMRGVLVGDKANSLVAYAADGTQRWQTQVRGNGVWTTPSVADINGDGSMEIIVAVRGTSEDGKAWYVLDTKGNVLGSFALPGGPGFGAPLVADIDRDGELEIIFMSRTGELSAFSFGGPAKPEAVFTTGWHGIRYQPATKVNQAKSDANPQPETLDIELLNAARYGHNRVKIRLPSARVPRHERLAVELDTLSPEGIRQVQHFKVAANATEVEATCPVANAGTYEMNARLLGLEQNQVLGTGSLTMDVSDLIQPIRAGKQASLTALHDTSSQVREEAPDATIALASYAAKLEASFQLLEERIGNSANLNAAAKGQLAADVDDFLNQLTQANNWAALTASEVKADRTPSFMLWQDDNPWNNDDPRDTLPKQGGPLAISLWAFGNETESVAINVANLTSQGHGVRWEPGTLVGKDVSLPAHKVVNLHRVLRVPSRFGEIVPDLLPPLGGEYMIQVASGEVEQVWLNISTRDLPSGKYTLRWPVRSFDQSSVETELTIQLRVSSVRLPEKSRFAMGFWSKRNIGELSTIENLNAHGQTVWYQLPLPPAQANAQGEIVSELEWEEHDAILKQVKQIDKLFYGGIPAPSFPEGVEVTDELRRAGRRNYLYVLVGHLEMHGLGWQDFMVYPADEPGLFGTIDHYMRSARENKALDPRLQNYANPWGSITLDDIREMAPVTDVWQPGMETIYVLGKEYVEAMRAGGKPVWMYTPPGNARVLRPLGFYRAQPWLAFHWGVEGGGWWVYHEADHWATHPDREPAYGGVASDGRSIVNTRRWEATRDGAEDYNALSLLREQLQKQPDAAADALLNEATTYVEKTAFTGMPREAADYDLDFAKLMDYRTQIRDALERLSD